MYVHVSIDAFDFDLMVSTLKKLREGGRVEVPVYDFTTHSRAKYTVRISTNAHCISVVMYTHMKCTTVIWQSS